MASQFDPKINSRRPHKKSRDGCLKCKARKVKCDEERPACRNCVKQSVECQYQTTKPRIANISVGSHNPPTPSHSSIGGSPHSESQGDSLNLLDLELLHNYDTLTFNSLSNDPVIKTMWRVNVPEIAFEHEFVMRSILALSALHLAHCHPQKRGHYIAQAMNQHKRGLQMASATLKYVSEQNCAAHYIFSALTCIYAVASAHELDNILISGENGIPSWFTLLRGIASIVIPYEDTLKSGSLGPMFSAGAIRSARRLNILQTNPPESIRHLKELEQLITRSITDPEILMVYTKAIDHLAVSYVSTGERDAETADVFIWLFRVSDQYLSLLRNNKQEALVILAFFCVSCNVLENRWWLEGLATHLMTRVYRVLDHEHRLWIRWPMEELGWLPNQDSERMEVSHPRNGMSSFLDC